MASDSDKYECASLDELLECWPKDTVERWAMKAYAEYLKRRKVRQSKKVSGPSQETLVNRALKSGEISADALHKRALELLKK